jgi:hypothetical protein
MIRSAESRSAIVEGSSKKPRNKLPIGEWVLRPFRECCSTSAD